MLALVLTTASTMKDLTFLTRDGCINTPDMVNDLDPPGLTRRLQSMKIAV